MDHLENESVCSLVDSKFLRKKQKLRKKIYYDMDLNSSRKKEKKLKDEESKENDYTAAYGYGI